MKKTLSTLVAAMLISGAALAEANGPSKTYEVTITNITKTQKFTPILVATHKEDIGFFTAGMSASGPLAILAESGNPGPLNDVLLGAPDLVLDTTINGALLEPGASVTVTVEGHDQYDRLSLSAMLIPTNDTFVALNSVPLPRFSATYAANAYDAGSELNDELCTTIPGPPCFGEAISVADGEGFVHMANGIQGIGDVDPAAYDWRGAVASVTVTWVR
jgi:hypothetical protein